jgi:enamine deaminase RidA (YjgF/YER057c/UK114 family)
MSLRRLIPTGIHPPLAHYAHGVEVPPGTRLVFCSGQLGIDATGSIPESAEAQADLCFRAIGAVLAEAGMGFADVIRLNAYVVDRTVLPAYMATRDRFIRPPFPASTLMIVAGFSRPQFKVEVEALAGRPEALP